ncbi:hypothetical protein BBJ29_008661 [Phytophthora kernoviae]|uniref:HSF-type DNA-binding domain-containing protein n=1 Tax=Phytophthora kernoviae TaxID=325452 RepID=A0A3F2RD69_9STRA|nr:hypothetical protein BBJ29_008661 [Phytophthora kernoviae]RLN53656.1 hypothetical protein BBP00_00009234 [Phytophthora kernoviae]
MSRATPKQPVTQDPADGTTAKEVAPFLRSLRRMLDAENPRILRWTPDGKAFEIHDMVAMTSYVLPKYFKHRKYASFQRQLNYFHFRKWTKSRAVVCAGMPRNTSPRSKSPMHSPFVRSNPNGQITKQLESLVTLQPAIEKDQPEMIDEDASLAWIDVLYPELDLGSDFLEEDRTFGSFFSTKVFAL